MESKKNGLTVGELTMAIGALIIATLILTAFNKSRAPKDATSQLIHYSLTSADNA